LLELKPAFLFEIHCLQWSEIRLHMLKLIRRQ
jgi:hypothetical protein